MQIPSAWSTPMAGRNGYDLARRRGHARNESSTRQLSSSSVVESQYDRQVVEASLAADSNDDSRGIRRIAPSGLCHRIKMLGRICDTQRPKAVEEHETRGKMDYCKYSYAAWLLLLCGGLPGLL